MKLNKSQERSIARIRHFVEEGLNKNPEYGDEIVDWEVKDDSGLIFVTARTCMSKLSEGNLLRAVSGEHYLFHVRSHGAVEMLMGPRSMKQFNGRKAFGFIHVRMS